MEGVRLDLLFVTGSVGSKSKQPCQSESPVEMDEASTSFPVVPCVKMPMSSFLGVFESVRMPRVVSSFVPLMSMLSSFVGKFRESIESMLLDEWMFRESIEPSKSMLSEFESMVPKSIPSDDCGSWRDAEEMLDSDLVIFFVGELLGYIDDWRARENGRFFVPFITLVP